MDHLNLDLGTEEARRVIEHNIAHEIELGADTTFRKQLPGIVKAIDLEAKTVDFVVSTEDVDRDGDIIRSEGWELDAFRQNPVVLWAHQHGIPRLPGPPRSP